MQGQGRAGAGWRPTLRPGPARQPFSAQGRRALARGRRQAHPVRRPRIGAASSRNSSPSTLAALHSLPVSYWMRTALASFSQPFACYNKLRSPARHQLGRCRLAAGLRPVLRYQADSVRYLLLCHVVLSRSGCHLRHLMPSLFGPKAQNLRPAAFGSRSSRGTGCCKRRTYRTSPAWSFYRLCGPLHAT